MITLYGNNPLGLVKAQSRENAVWISAVAPNAEETKFLIHDLKIPQAFYNDIEDIDERPRIEHEDGWTLIILRMPFKSADEKLPYTTAPLGIIFNDDICVSLCFVENELIDDFIVYSQRKTITVADNFSLVFRLLLASSMLVRMLL